MSWEKLSQYTRYYFGGTKRGGKKKKNHATVINKKLESFKSDTIQPNTFQPNMDPPSLRGQVSGKLSMGDVSGAVRLMTSSNKVLAPKQK